LSIPSQLVAVFAVAILSRALLPACAALSVTSRPASDQPGPGESPQIPDLHNVDGKPTLLHLITDLGCREPTVRNRAIEQLVRLGTIAVEPVVDAFINGNLATQLAVLEVLRQWQAPVDTMDPWDPKTLTSNRWKTLQAWAVQATMQSPSPAPIDEGTRHLLENLDANKTNPDCIIHTLHALPDVPHGVVFKSLSNLAQHASWRIRAEVANTISNRLKKHGDLSGAATTEVGSLLIRLLNDNDPFVVSQTVAGLQLLDTQQAVEPMVEAVQRHPALAEKLFGVLAQSPNMRHAAVPQLRLCCRNENASIRAAAVTALCAAAPHTLEQELVAALRDRDRRVRLAAAQGLFTLIESQRPRADYEGHIHAKSLNGSQPATSVLQTPARETQTQIRERQWIQDFRAGRHRPKWVTSLIDPLVTMLKALSIEEQAIAAVALIPLGQQAKALPVLITATESKPEIAVQAAEVLPWLDWKKRLELFNRLTALRLRPGQLDRVMRAMVRLRDKRVAKVLWEHIARANVDLEVMRPGLVALRRLYFGDLFHSPAYTPPEDRQWAITDAVRRAQSGSDVQRLAALAFLLPVSPMQAGTIAQAIVDAPQASETLRHDAFIILLLSLNKKDAQERAQAARSSPHAGIQKVARAHLANERITLATLDGAPLEVIYDHLDTRRNTFAPSPPAASPNTPTEPTMR